MCFRPFGFFLLIHAFLCFSFLHFLMIYGIGIDLFFEYVYQVLNLFRLMVFPLVISAFVSAHLERHSFAMWDVLSDVEKLEKTRDFAKKFSDFLSQTYNKNPKTTLASAGVTVTLAGVLAWGAHVEKKLDAVKGVFSSKDINAYAISQDPELKKAFMEVINFQLRATHSWMSLTMDDVGRFFRGEPLILTQYQQVLKEAVYRSKVIEGELSLSSQDVQKMQSQQHAQALETKGSFAASSLPEPSPCVESKSSPGVECSSSGGDVISNSTEIPSCLEWSWPFIY